MIKFNRIIAYGCSMTSGWELADHQFLSDMTEDEINALKDNSSIGEWCTFMDLKVPPSERILVEAKLAWPNWIAEYYNVKYVNRAIAGGNSQSTIYFIEQDLASGFITDTDLIIVGHTESCRWFWINSKGESSHCLLTDNDLDPINTWPVTHRWPSNAFYKDFVIHVCNTYHLTYQWFHDIKYLDLLSNKLNGRVVQVYCYNTLTQELDMNPKFYDSKFDSVLDDMYSFNTLVDWNNFDQIHRFGHPKARYHKEFAEHIIKKLELYIYRTS